MSFYYLSKEMGLALNDILGRVCSYDKDFSRDDIAITWINYKSVSKRVFKGFGYGINNKKMIYPKKKFKWESIESNDNWVKAPEYNFKDRKLDVMYANDCNGMVLYQQFEYENEKIDINNNEVVDKVKWLYESYKESPSFQACFLLFHKNLIKDETFDNLLNCHTLYYVYYKLTRDGLTEEQAILNLEFYNRWEELSDKFLNAYPRANELKWEFDKMGEAFEDEHDYKKDGLMAIHFYQFFQPWSEHNLRFYPIWKKYNDRF